MSDIVNVPCIVCGGEFRVTKAVLASFPHGKGIGQLLGGCFNCTSGIVAVDMKVVHRGGDMCPRCGLLFIRQLLERFEARGEVYTGAVIGEKGTIF